jgi:CHAT domain-containing protein
MSYKKIILLNILFCYTYIGFAQSWENCYDSTAYFFQKKNYTASIQWADKFMIFSNLFLTNKKTHLQFQQVTHYATQSYLFTNQKEKGIAKLVAWQKHFEEISTNTQSELENNKSLLISDLSYHLAELYYYVGKYALAKNNYENALQGFDKHLGEDTAIYEECLQKLGNLLYELGDYEEAERILLDNTNLTEELYGKEHIQHAEALNQAGDVFSAKSDTSTAMYFYKQAKEIYENQKDGLNSISHAHNLKSQGELYYQMGFYTASEALYRQAEYIYQKNNYLQKPAYADLLNKFSQIYLRLNNVGDAYRLIEQAKKINLEAYSPQHPAYAKDLYVLGSIYLKTKDLKKAENLLVEALNIFQKSNTHKQPYYFLTMSQLAKCFELSIQFAKAETFFQTALDSFTQNVSEKNIELAGIEADLANLYYKMGRYDDASEMHEACLETRYNLLEESHPELLESLNDMSLLYWAHKKISKAEKLFEQSIESYAAQFNRYFSFLSEIEKEFYYKRIRDFFEKYNNFAIEHSKKKSTILGKVYDTHLINKGLLFYTNQKIRQEVLANKDENLLQKYKSWIQLKEQLAKVYKLDTEEIIKQGIPLDSLEEVTNFIEKDLSLRIAIGNTKEGKETDAVSWKDIQRKLNADEAAIEMLRLQEFKPDSGGYFTEKIYYAALIVTPKTMKNPYLILLENGNDLEERRVKFYRNSIKFRIKDNQSYKYFWQAIDTASVLKGIKKIYFSPDGVYNQLNVNTLYDDVNAKYVLDKIEVHTLTNTRDLIEIKKKNIASNSNTNKDNKGAVLLGFPNYQYKRTKNTASLEKNASNSANSTTRTRGLRGNQFRGGKIEELPGTKEEVLAIQSILKEYNVPDLVVLGDSASESMIKKLQQPKYLHIATHGFFNPDINILLSQQSDSVGINRERDIPLMNSGLLLVGAANAYSDETILEEINALRSGNTFEDGMFTAYEAMNLDLRETELVVLSACETGLGEIRNGEGVYGLQRAFQTAGAKTIVMSLWKVSDEATKELMVNLYSELSKNNNKRQAFLNAQLKLREQFADAYFWGAFVMVGE